MHRLKVTTRFFGGHPTPTPLCRPRLTTLMLFDANNSFEADTVDCSVFSLAQCHATAEVSNDAKLRLTLKWLKFAAGRNMMQGDTAGLQELKSQKENCLDHNFLLLKGGCCQTSWRHGLIFNIVHLTVCKKVGCETRQSVFSCLFYY